MKKNTFYFSHDYNARSDGKIKKLFAKFGASGYGLYWCIIEDLYQNANALQTDYDSIAYDLRTDVNIVKSIINDFDLFVIDGNIFKSLSVERRLLERNSKSESARKSATYRWDKERENANAMQTQCDSNAIKESKVKESKVKKINSNINDIEMRFQAFNNKVIAFRDLYSDEMLMEFIEYWTEKTDNGKKMLFEMQKVFEVSKRLAKWKRNENKFKNNSYSNGNKPQLSRDGSYD